MLVSLSNGLFKMLMHQRQELKYTYAVVTQLSAYAECMTVGMSF